MDKIIGHLAGLGVPGLILIIVTSTSGVAGGAAIVSALAALGGPLGMIGGLALLAIVVMISKAVAEHGFEHVLKLYLSQLKSKGMTKEEILKEIDKYKKFISDDLNFKLKAFVNEFYS